MTGVPIATYIHRWRVLVTWDMLGRLGAVVLSIFLIIWTASCEARERDLEQRCLEAGGVLVMVTAKQQGDAHHACAKALTGDNQPFDFVRTR